MVGVASLGEVKRNTKAEHLSLTMMETTMVDGGNGVDTTTNNATTTAYEEAMEDVHTRFILNLPDDELRSAPRIFFQLEQAWWFYDDFICDGAAAAAAAAAAALAEEVDDADDGNNNNNSKKKIKKKKKKNTPEKVDEPLPRFKHMKPFSHAMFHLSPLLRPMLPQFETMYEEFSTYKRSISTYGTILLNDDGTKIALCRTWKGKSWTLPGGKVNQGESGLDAAARETYEETGFDPQCERGLCAMLKENEAEGRLPYGLTELPWKSLQENTDKLRYTEADTNKRRTCYVCRGVPEDFPFEPVARKEVAEVAWHDLTNLPKQTFGLIPFVGQLKGWIKRDNKKKGLLPGSGRRSGSTPKTPSQQHQSPRPRGKQPRHDDVDGDDGFILTPYFNDDGSTPWGDDDVVTPGNTSHEGGGNIASPTDISAKGNNKQRDGSRAKKDKQQQQQSQQRAGSQGKKRSDSRATSRGSSAAAAAGASREVLATDPLVLSALASPGESNRWTENEMFTANEALLGRKIIYDGNPHDFAEKGFDISENGRNDPHAFRIVGGTFMNSKEGGALSLPPDATRLQPLMSRQRSVSTEVSGLSVDAGGVEDCGRMVPFFLNAGKAPWEDSHVDSGTRSNSRGLPFLDGGSAADNAKDITIVQKALEGSLASLDDLFMTDREITARSQKVKLTILPKNADKSDKTPANNNEHGVWMKQWVQQLPQSQSTTEFGDFRIDVNAVMNAMDSYIKVNTLK